MFFSIVSTMAMAGVAGFSYLKTSGPATNDVEKIKRIFESSGWVGKGESLTIQRKAQLKDPETKKRIGMEYIFQYPLGFDRESIKKHVLEDSLNIKHKFSDFEPRDLLTIKFDKNIVSQIKSILTSKKSGKKEIEWEFDGMLRIKVYNEALPDQMFWTEKMLRKNTWAVPIGVNRSGMIYHDFDESKHLIIAGVPGSGKSVVMKLIITCLTLQKPEDVTFSLVDLKGGPAFARFRDTKQLKHLAVDTTEALQVLKEVEADMERVYKDVLVPQGFEDVKEAGITKRHFVIIDEAADLAGDREAMDVLTNIVRKGRGSGHFVIYATQYPTVETVKSQIKRNIPARLTYVLDSGTASTAVLDTNGAEDLPNIPGRGIYKLTKLHTIQTPLMKNTEIKTRIEPYINIKPREEKKDGQKSGQTTENRKYSIEFKKV